MTNPECSPKLLRLRRRGEGSPSMSWSATSPTLARAAITAGGTLAYLGLAILGWGGFAAFFAHPARTALALVLIVLAGAALFSHGNLSPGEREDRGNRWVIAVFALVGLLLAYLPAWTDREGVWTIDGDA